MSRHRRIMVGGQAVTCICPAARDHAELNPIVPDARTRASGTLLSRPSTDRAPAPRPASKPVDPNVYQPRPRPQIRTRPCPECRVTCELVTTVKGADQLLEVLARGEYEDPDGLIIMIDTPNGRRAKQYGKGKVPTDAGPRRKPHIAVCAKGGDRWIRKPAPRRSY